MAKSKSQLAAVLEYMQKHGSITTWQAITELRVTRLSAIIFRLRERGYKISAYDQERERDDGSVARWVEYRLVGDNS